MSFYPRYDERQPSGSGWDSSKSSGRSRDSSRQSIPGSKDRGSNSSSRDGKKLAGFEMSSHSRYDDRRHSSSSRRDRDSSQSSRRDRDSSRRSSPGPSRGRSPPPRPRDDNELPVEFGRPMELESREDENTVIRRMKTAFTHSPLSVIYRCIREKKKIKIWTRNFKEVRGICTGYVIAFDKHWNLVLTDVEEVFVKPKRAKTPFLLDIKSGDDLPELAPKVPGEKKPKTPEEEAQKKAEEEAKKAEASNEDEAKKQKRARKKGKGTKCQQRHLKTLFVRGDNIVMCSVLDVVEVETVEDGDAEADVDTSNQQVSD